jgi:hypothetical protein
MKILIIYLIICFLWGWFAVYKQSQYSLKSTLKKYIFIYFLNFFLFPCCLIIATKNKKLTFKNNLK